jgi:tripartite-type tricarboxylate transporter receptor subunit TctC
MVRVLTAFLALVLTMGADQSHADTYPSRPITLVIPFAVGGTTDIIARLIADGLKERLGQPVIVLNKPGAAGQIGDEFAAVAQPDGYTLLISTNVITAGPYVSKENKLDPLTAFTHIIYLAEGHDLLLANPRLPVKTAADLVAYAKSHQGMLNIATWAPSTDLNVGMLTHQAGIRLTTIPYRGSTPAIMALAANEIDLVLSGNPISRPLIDDKKLNVLGVASLKPYRLAPGVPLLTDTGIPGFESRGAWFGLSGPKGIPAVIVARLNTEVNALLQTPSFKETLNNTIMHEAIGGTPDEFIAALKSDIAFFRDAVRVTNYQPQ